MTLNSIVANFQTFKLVDLLDILIIAFLIYQLLGFVNRTRAGQLAKGALIVMAVYLVANILNMRTVTWLLNSLLQVGLLTLVVLFQPEIRRALERMGQTDQWAYRFFNKNRYNDTSLKGAWRSAIIAICDAAERFSETKTGALIVLAVYLVANILNMRTVTWLLNSLLQVGLLTLVVLFQPEIRRALERMGQTDQWAYRFFNKNRYNDTSLKGAWRSAIIAICDAAERFSETKTGALIVLERNTNLSEIVRTGTPVNSAVNLEVLGTIFYEGTPLHDGAAIIENGRIKAAGCVLPLSNNLDLGKDMGTRHRACLGIAENSDAIAIVVSEETGIISMAKNGVLMRHFDRQTLYTRLVDEMIPKETASEKSAAEGWKARGKRLLNWVNNKEEDEQQ